jgi:hypothetical protein
LLGIADLSQDDAEKLSQKEDFFGCRARAGEPPLSVPPKPNLSPNGTGFFSVEYGASQRRVS